MARNILAVYVRMEMFDFRLSVFVVVVARAEEVAVSFPWNTKGNGNNNSSSSNFNRHQYKWKQSIWLVFIDSLQESFVAVIFSSCHFRPVSLCHTYNDAIITLQQKRIPTELSSSSSLNPCNNTSCIRAFGIQTDIFTGFSILLHYTHTVYTNGKVYPPKKSNTTASICTSVSQSKDMAHTYNKPANHYSLVSLALPQVFGALLLPSGYIDSIIHLAG